MKSILKFLTNDKAQELIRAAMMPTPEGRALFKSLLMPLNTLKRVEIVSKALGPFLGAEFGQVAEEILGSRENRFAPVVSRVPQRRPFMDGLRGGTPATFAGGLLAQ